MYVLKRVVDWMCSICTYMPYLVRCHCCWPSHNRNIHGPRCSLTCLGLWWHLPYGKWDVDIWEVLLGKFMGKILGCPFATATILDWKQVLSRIKWASPIQGPILFVKKVYIGVLFLTFLLHVRSLSRPTIWAKQILGRYMMWWMMRGTSLLFTKLWQHMD